MNAPNVEHARVRATALWAALHALLLALSFEPVGWWFCAPLSVAAFGWCALRARSTRVALLTIFIAQVPAWLWLHLWILQMTRLGYPVPPIYMAGYGVLIAWLFRRAMHHRRFGRWPAAVVLAVAWIGFECLRGRIVFDGYNWFLLGHAFAASVTFMQPADLLGTYFLSFLAVCVGGAIVDALRMWNGSLPRRTGLASIVTAALIVASSGGYGLFRRAETDRIVSAAGATSVFRVLAIQTNLPQSNKIAWSPQEQVRDFREFLQQTVAAINGAAQAGGQRPPIDLVIWPETMTPGYGLEPAAIAYTVERGLYPGDVYLDALRELNATTGVPLLVGSPSYIGLRVNEADRSYEWDAHYNSAYLIEQGGPPYQRSDKVFLTPFGERMPYIELWPWLEQKLLGFGGTGMTFTLDAADEPTILGVPSGSENRGTETGSENRDTEAGSENRGTEAGSENRATVQVATPICFEATVGWVCRSMVYDADGRKRADVLVNLSNDGWFGWSEAGRAQHAQMARLRCVENRVPMIRCANTGLSIAYDSGGNVIGKLGEGRYGTGRAPGALAVTLPLDGRTTLYSRVGDTWAWACLAATVGLIALTWRRR